MSTIYNKEHFSVVVIAVSVKLCIVIVLSILFEKALQPGLEVVKFEYSLKLKIKCTDWLPASSQSLHFILSLRINSSFITSRPGDLNLHFTFQ